MPSELSLVDQVCPYVLQGDTFGAWHAVLDILGVPEHEIAAENGIKIRGTIEFEGIPTVDPSNMSLAFSNTENHPENDASRRDPWIDVRDTRLDFQLVMPRTASQKMSTAVSTIGKNAAFATTPQVLVAYDIAPTDAPLSDYPTPEYVLDLLMTSVVLRPPSSPRCQARSRRTACSRPFDRAVAEGKALAFNRANLIFRTSRRHRTCCRSSVSSSYGRPCICRQRANLLSSSYRRA